MPYLLALFIFDGGCLVFALVLCYVSRYVPSEFTEAKWITAAIISIFQILLLAGPVLVIVQDDTNAFFFVRVGIIFLLTSTVSLLMFAPKIYQLHFKKTDREDPLQFHNRVNQRTSTNLRNSQLITNSTLMPYASYPTEMTQIDGRGALIMPNSGTTGTLSNVSGNDSNHQSPRRVDFTGNTTNTKEDSTSSTNQDNL